MVSTIAYGYAHLEDSKQSIYNVPQM
jgi:hypothetical protein